MVERKEVEALLSEATNPRTKYQVQTSISLATLAVLCRAWLALQDAPKVKVRGKVGEVCMVPVSHDFCGQRVRIAKEAGE